MVSTSDTAKHIQFSSLKQDAAEAAFKARHSFGSSDAFKQIFDGIDKTTKTADAAKEAAPEPVKADNGKRVHERPHAHSSKRADDKSEQRSDCDKEDKAEDTTTPTPATDKQAQTKKAHVKEGKGKSSEHGCGHHHCADEDNMDSAEATDGTAPEESTASTDLVSVTPPAPDSTSEDSDAALSFADAAKAVITDEDGIATDTAPANLTGEAKTPALATGDKNLAPILLANLQGALNTDADAGDVTDIKSTKPSFGDFQKAVAIHQKPAHEKTAAATGDEDADSDLSAAFEAEVKLSKDADIKETKEQTKTEREAIKQANDKHADHIDILQGKFSAPETHPAAGDRAISVAQKAPDSSAPTLNGSAGGGSPINAKGAAISAAATGLEGVHGMQGDQQVTFAGTLRATKEVPTSMMAPNEQVAVHLHRMAKSGTSQYDLQLHPAELGRVDIRLEINKDGGVVATITADNQQAFDMLQKDSRALERALQQAGLQTDSGSLSFNLRGDNGSSAQQQAQNNNGAPWNKWMEKTLPEEAVQSKILSFDVNAGAGRVDLRV